LQSRRGDSIGDNLAAQLAVHTTAEGKPLKHVLSVWQSVVD
jgi:hypothetical protein